MPLGMTSLHSPADGQHDFDFLFGTWKVRNRRLAARLAGSTEWAEFDATVKVLPVWGGAANFDEYQGDAPGGGIEGCTLRLYNPASRQWTIVWSSRAVGIPDQPMVGAFEGDRGEFYNQEKFEGRSIYVRFIWRKGVATCHWNQAFSLDGGRSWETNWTMDFTRS